MDKLNKDLLNASRSLKLGKVRMLLAQGADVNTLDISRGFTPLHWAASEWQNKDNHRVYVVSYLVEKGASIETSDKSGMTPLLSAARSGHLDVVQYLFKKGANLFHKDFEDNTVLHLSAIDGDIKLVNLCISQGVEINAINKLGSTALHKAAWCGHFEAVKCLIEKGADAAILNNDKKTALDEAIKNKRQDIVDYLKEFELSNTEMISLESAIKTELISDNLFKF